MKNRYGGKIADGLIGLLFLLYPVLCRVDVYVRNNTAIGCLTVVAVCCSMVVMAHTKSLRLKMADMLLVGSGLWSVITYFVFAREKLDPLSGYECTALFLIYFSVRNTPDTKRLVRFLLPGVLVQAVLCYVQLSGLTPSNHTHFSFTGSFDNPGPLAGFLACSLFFYPCLLYNFGSRRKTGFWWLLSGGVATLFLIVYSGSRASWLALCAGSVVCIWPDLIHWYRRSKASRRRTGMGALVCIVIALGIGLYALRPQSANGRWLIWKSSYSLFIQSPVCGNGPESFSREYMYHQAVYLAERLSSDEAILADNVTNAFNEPIRILCEYGVIGLVVFGAWIACTMTGALHPASSGKIKYLAAGFTALLVFGLFSYPAGVYPMRLLFVILAALLVKESPCKAIRAFHPNRLVKGVLLLVLFLLLVTVTTQYISSRSFENQVVRCLIGESGSGSGFFTQAPQQCKNNPDILLLYGRLLCKEEEYEKAIPVFEQVAAIAPSSFLFMELGLCHDRLGNKSATEHCLQTAVNMTPGYVVPVYRLFQFYREAHNTRQALRWAYCIANGKFKTNNSAVLAAKKEANTYIRQHD